MVHWIVNVNVQVEGIGLLEDSLKANVFVGVRVIWKGLGNILERMRGIIGEGVIVVGVMLEVAKCVFGR